MKVGNGLDKDTKIGPLIEEKAVAKVEEHVARCSRAKARR